MAKDIDLDQVYFAPQVRAAWLALADQAGHTLALLKEAGVDIPAIPDERGRIEDDGSLTIYVSVPNVIDVSMSVPPGQWQYMT